MDDLKVYDEDGREMKHPMDVLDTLNDSARGILEYLDYKKRYEFLKEKMIQQGR